MNPLNRNDGLEGLFFLFGSTLVYKTSSSYQNIYVTERSQYEGKRGKFRALQFSLDGIQGIINMEHPQSLVASYSRITVDLIDHYASDFKKGFIIGHGIGTVSSYYSHKHMLTAEIDPLVVEVSKKYFGHTGKNVLVGDGQALLKNQETQSQDIIFLDAYSSSEIPSHLTTKEFFTLTNEKLSDQGILIINYLGKINNDKFLHTLYERISEIFPYVKVFATNSENKTKQNLFLVASRRLQEDYSPQEAIPIQIMGK
ncbi:MULTISPECIES: spermidine synthase [Bacillaceae]|uniref:spermidine synthase n=1 Tax=Bacillaceae TaxID=186817 RepID=UPI000BFEA44B|nr:fused MFS/spermidine synthase [Bacillus sp. AFS031507]PGY08389.1 spermidine synthase [Bacillus sp. AFS031507]